MRIQRLHVQRCRDLQFCSYPICDRNVVISWTDAASTARLLSAVFFNGFTFEYTRMAAPSRIMNDSVQRNDGMIGMLELLAVLLVLETLKDQLKYARLASIHRQQWRSLRHHQRIEQSPRRQHHRRQALEEPTHAAQ